MTIGDRRILVVGATGNLGGVIARKLLAAGLPVRAFGRNQMKLDELRSLGAEVVAGDLLDKDAVSRACAGVDQIVTTANNAMGHGASSPNRVEVPMNRNLCESAKQQGVGRLVYVSGRGMGGLESPVDFFRLKKQTEEIVRESGVPYVLLCPTLFMETWVDMLADSVRKKGVVVLFGDGRTIANFIATDDVAEFAVRILQRQEIRNESIEIGGPSNLSFADLATLVERQLGVPAKRRRIPVPVLRVGAALLRPIHEVASRLMSMGYLVSTLDCSFAGWRASADRFGVSPITMESYVARRFARR